MLIAAHRQNVTTIIPADFLPYMV